MTQDVCILNSGSAAWAFEPLAEQLSKDLDIPVSEEPLRLNYLLSYEDISKVQSSFVPLTAMQIAADKRRIAAVFTDASVPAPRTVLLDSSESVTRHLQNSHREWCLKFPTSCGGAGHLLLAVDSVVPETWPRPYVVQEFIRMDEPSVYRTYIGGSSLFGWVIRKFPTGVKAGPWVAHARGAHYVIESSPPKDAAAAALKAFNAVGLLGSFGCADLIQNAAGEWLVLEVGTDGLFNHVDRNLDSPVFASELRSRLKSAFEAYVRGN